MMYRPDRAFGRAVVRHVGPDYDRGADLSRIGASQVGVMLGWNRRHSRYRLALELRGVLQPWGGDARSRRGLALEPWIAGEWVALMGGEAQLLAEPPGGVVLMHPVVDVLGGTPDRWWVRGGDGLSGAPLELKDFDSRCSDALHELGRGRVDPSGDAWAAQVARAWAQVQTVLEICGAETGGLAVAQHKEVRAIVLYRDRRFGDLVVSEAGRFWGRYVAGSELPDIGPDDIRAAWVAGGKAAERGFAAADDELRRLLAEYDQAAEQLADARPEMQRIERARDQARARLAAWLVDHDAIATELDGREVAWGGTSRRVDVARLRREAPDVAETYTQDTDPTVVVGRARR